MSDLEVRLIARILDRLVVAVGDEEKRTRDSLARKIHAAIEASQNTASEAQVKE